jgi:hypothetical protein
MRDDRCRYITCEAFLLARQEREKRGRGRLRRVVFMSMGIVAVFFLVSWSY